MAILTATTFASFIGSAFAKIQGKYHITSCENPDRNDEPSGQNE